MQVCVTAGDPVERRAIEFSMRPKAADSLQTTAHGFATQASSQDAKYSHIDAADKQKVMSQPLPHWQCLGMNPVPDGVNASVQCVHQLTAMSAGLLVRSCCLHRAVPEYMSPASAQQLSDLHFVLLSNASQHIMCLHFALLSNVGQFVVCPLLLGATCIRQRICLVMQD